MNEKIEVPTMKVPPLKRICMTIGQLPASYVESMSYYEMLVWFIHYLRDDIIPVVNANGEATRELQELYVELQSYVNNYFDNLDVQEEINNKLDEMAESGQLTDIIAQYLGLAGMITFNNVAEMKVAENLVNGSKCKTLGFNNVNDGGGAYYKIRQVTNDDVIDEMFLIEVYDDLLVAELITEPLANICQLGANENETNNSTFINASLNKLNYAYIPVGTYPCTGTITLKEKQTLYGEDKTQTILNYTGSSNFITNEDIGTCRNISIHDLTINGTSKTGKGIYLIRTTKTGDTWHRLNNLYVTNFDIGIHLYKSLNEIMLNDVVSNSNNTGIKIENVDDFYLDNIVTAVNSLTGLFITNSTEARISNVKAWYNGASGTDLNTKVNISVSTCNGIMMTNIGCQESYHSNIRVAYSKDVSITNCYLSHPNLDHTAADFQILFEANNNVTLNCNTANTKVDNEYFNKIIEYRNRSYNCDLNIKCENDYPDSMKEAINDSSKGQALEICNSIKIQSQNLRQNTKLNYALNGDLSNTSTMDMVQSGSDKLSWENGLLRLNSGDSQSGASFKTTQLPVVGNYTWYVKFKKVSGSGRVVLDYTCYADIGADDPVGTEYCASKMYTNANTTAKTNLYIRLPANTIIDIIEIGYCYGESGELNLPLYGKAKI